MVKDKDKDIVETRGERLKRLRKAKGISLEQAHQGTKIHTKILKALEEDAVVGIAPAYAKGLLKIYCSFLGVDPKDFIEEYTEGDSAKRGMADSPKSDSSNVEVEVPLVKPHINIAVIKNKIKTKPAILIIYLLILAIATFKLGRSISIYRVSSSKESPSVAAVPSPEVTSTSQSDELRLDIRAKQDCWLEVKTDGKTIFRSVIKKGQLEYWEAKEEIEFSLGNAGGVDVEINGKLLSPLGRRGQVIKNIKITKQGLIVPK